MDDHLKKLHPRARSNPLAVWMVGIFTLICILISLDRAIAIGVESLWYAEVGYNHLFWQRLLFRLELSGGVLLITWGFLLGNLALANRWKHPMPINGFTPVSSKHPYHLKLPGLCILGGGITFLLAGLILYLCKVGIGFSQLPSHSPLPPLPLPFQLSVLGQEGPDLLRHPWQGVALLGLVVGLLWQPLSTLRTTGVLAGLGVGWIASELWIRVIPAIHGVPFHQDDPVFVNDLSFYIFQLPVWRLLWFWLGGISLYALLSVVLIYLLSGDSLSQGQFVGFSSPQLRHIHALGGWLMMMIAFGFWLSRFQLLYSPRGSIYGAAYTDIHIQLPVNTTLSLLALSIAFFLLLRSCFWPSRYRTGLYKRDSYPYFSASFLYPLSLFFIVSVVAGYGLPAIIQQMIVEPNELARESPYIRRGITFTQAGFGLHQLEVKAFDPIGSLNQGNLDRNELTLKNIRLWDKRPLLQTNRQLQQIRPYYRFYDADIDRYTLHKTSQDGQWTKAGKIEQFSPSTLPIPPSSPPEKQQVLIAARELDTQSIPTLAQTWINRHLIYTHGYGFTLSPVNRAGNGGLPDYFVKDIALDSGSTGVDQTRDGGNLGTANEQIRASLPIGHPRIYYGELTNHHVITDTGVRELDYPTADGNAYNTYDGKGGVVINSPWRRAMIAYFLKDWQLWLSRQVTSKTKVLFRRNILERAQAIAPFLQFDSSPYLVVADAQLFRPLNRQPSHLSKNEYLYWVLDAYTLSDYYPYSDPYLPKGNAVDHGTGFNYIRNSVKVVVDAYHGTTRFYIADPTDPLITAWSHIFPDTFQPLTAMPPAIRSHIRYPTDFFRIQSERLLTYHMNDPQEFYNREDLWQIPKEIYGQTEEVVEPYYLITKLPQAKSEEFILLLPFTPTGRNNLIGWLAGRSDGMEYGKLLLYQFPKQRLVFGPAQIEARINQDPLISQQISLWNRKGSRVIQGNLLVVPIEQSLLYVEPIYLEAEQNSLPTLARVVVAYGDRIAMAETLESALNMVIPN